MTNQRQLIYKDEARRAVLHTSPSVAFCIDRIKSVDAVEVVRCKNCCHYTKEKNKAYDGHYCARMVEFVQPDDFCSYGERENDGI